MFHRSPNIHSRFVLQVQRLTNHFALEAALKGQSPVENRVQTDTRTSAGSSIFDQANQGAQALWHEVYEHPGTTALAVGAVVAGAAAVYATRGNALRAFTGAGKDILLVEDTPFIGKAMKSALEANGERVTWITGVNRVSPLTGTTLDGLEMAIDPKKFKLALVDGELEGSYLQGEHVVHALKQGGLPSIGTSSVDNINDAMVRNGAALAAPKSTIVSALADNTLDLRGAIKQPTALQNRLDQLTDALKGESGKELRKSGKALLSRFM